MEFLHHGKPEKKALACANALGLFINVDWDKSTENYEHIDIMKGAKVVFSGSKGESISMLCGLSTACIGILSLLKADGIHIADKEAALKCLHETVLRTKNKAIYKNYIYPMAAKGGDL